MTLENALRLHAAIVPSLEAALAGSEAHLSLRLALTLIEDELLSLGWKNMPADVPAMETAAEWVRGQMA